MRKPNRSWRMSNTQNRSGPSQAFKPVADRRLWKTIPLLAAFYGLVWLYLDPSARYYASAPVFYLEGDFLLPFLKRPGGPLEYVSAGLAQLDYYAWLGAGVFSLLVALLGLGSSLLIGEPKSQFRWAGAFPGFILLVLYGQYSPPVIELAGGVLLALALLCGWRVWTTSSSLVRQAIFPFLAVALFYATGPFPCLLFIGAGGLHETFGRRDLGTALAGWLLVLPWMVGVVICNVDLGAVVRRWGNVTSIVAVAGLYAFLPALMAWGAFRARLRPGAKVQSPNPRKHSTVAGRGIFRFTARRLSIAGAGLAVLAVAISALTFDTERRALIRIQSEANRENWSGVLAAAARLRNCPTPARLQINRALFHLGRLTSDLFAFPQRSGVDLLASLSDGLAVCVPLSDTLLELGQVNLAEHYAHEALEWRGERPELLWRLARINLVKERPAAARVFLKRLGRVPFHRARAERWLRSLDRDPTMAGEEEIVRLRSFRVTSDLVERHFSTEELLGQLLQSNRQNRMALEYLMAHFLLTHQAEQVAANLFRLDAAGYSSRPRHLSEALAASWVSGGGNLGEARGRQVDPETADRFQRFREALKLHGGPGVVIEPSFAQAFGETYWFYDLVGRSAPQTSRGFFPRRL